MIVRVISGGQTGADQAGWRAARAAEIITGGWMPRGFLTEDGPRPEFAELYGAKEHDSSQYPPRTRANVNEACATLWFGDPRSPGGRLTTSWARTVGVVFVYVIESPWSQWQPEHIARHLENAFVQQKRCPIGGLWRDGVVNISGNRESSAPGIGVWVEAYLTEVFRILKAA